MSIFPLHLSSFRKSQEITPQLNPLLAYQNFFTKFHCDLITPRINQQMMMKLYNLQQYQHAPSHTVDNRAINHSSKSRTGYEIRNPINIIIIAFFSRISSSSPLSFQFSEIFSYASLLIVEQYAQQLASTLARVEIWMGGC